MSDTRPCSPAGRPWGCAKHALVERNCRETAHVLMTEGDKARIAEHAGRRDSREDRAPTDPTCLDREDDPACLRGAFRRGGTRPIPERRENGDRRFLGSRRGAHVVPPGSTILDVLGIGREDAERRHNVPSKELRLPDARRTHI